MTLFTQLAGSDAPPGQGAADAAGGSGTMGPVRSPLAPKLVTLAAVVAVIGVVFWQMNPSQLLADTTTTGGDTGAHVALAAYLKSHLVPGLHLTGWYPGAYDGLPLYTFYFPLSDLTAALLGYVIPFGVAFKLATLLGSFLLPVAAWAFGRLAGLERPRPALLALATLPFLFDQSFTIYGGNLYSTLAGEYSYSLGLSIALVFLGVVVYGMRTGRLRAAGALLLAACLLAHLVPAMFALVGAGVLFLLSPPSWRRLWWLVATIGTGVLLVAFWAVPFAWEQPFTTNMGWLNVSTYMALLAPGGNRWALTLGAIGLLAAFARRSRPMILFGVLAAVSAAAVVLEPQGKLYNTRFVPLWWICVYLLAGFAVAEGGVAIAAVWRRLRMRVWAAEVAAAAADTPPGEQLARTVSVRRPSFGPWAPGAVAVPLVSLALVLGFVLPPLLVSTNANLNVGPVHIRSNNVRYWAQWNYSGYERKAAWPELEGMVQAVSRVARRDGCGRAFWEYNSDLVRFGTPMAPMLLPYWTDGCVDSQEGLLFESSATTPYHFIDQAELSAAPSEAVVTSTTGIRYGGVDVALGVDHLRLLGVRYFLASSPSVQAQADADPGLKLVATSGPWRSLYNGVNYTTTWKIYEVRDTAMVSALPEQPVVLSGVGASQVSWLPIAQRWYADPGRWSQQLVAAGPASWTRAGAAAASSGHALPATPEHTAKVSDIQVTADTVRFHVDRTGVPVLVKVSYFPAWQATGAIGPWRAMPNLMVVVPTAHDVVLHYGTPPAGRAGLVLSALGVVSLGVLIARRRSGFTVP
ncbi:MAG TPA: hypothetical protein VMU09_00015 [Acidimicrobiales bacterium]|nr:hypothetical protein [Acidimicrobiales bacterium]